MSYHTYVLRCADGSLYCGYTTNVEARLATHNAGKGAKYTQRRLPVKLVAAASFASRHAAMSTEWHFKRLSRERKDELLEAARATPFEDVLACAFGLDPRETDFEHDLRDRLHELADKSYAEFMAPLIPTMDPTRIIGVRTPDLRVLAREMEGEDGMSDFLERAPHELFEEQQVHAFLLNRIRDYDALTSELERFVPTIDNWATCDQLRPAALAKEPARTASLARAWMREGQADDRTYVRRFGMGVLMRWFLDDLFEPWMLEDVVASAPGDYYVDMMRAWYVAEALVRQPQAAMVVLEEGALDAWTHNKAISKACDSRRVSAATKERLRALRRTGEADHA